VRKVIALFAFSVSVLLVVAHAQQPQSNPLSGGARLNYQIIKGFVTAAAEKMPESNYGFQPTPEIRKFSELVAHLADANYRVCSIVSGQEPMDAGIERSNKNLLKADLTKALSESFAYCDKLYAGMNDTVAAEIIRFDAGGEGLRVPLQMPKLTALAFHVQHAFEHYGNIVTYMRLKNVVPPSSQIAPPTATRPSTGATATHTDVSGDWILHVETPNGPVVASLSVTKDGNNLSAEAKWDRGTVALTGVLSSNEVRFEGQMQTLKMTFTGKPGVESMSGKVEFLGHPSGTWSATRQ